LWSKLKTEIFIALIIFTFYNNLYAQGIRIGTRIEPYMFLQKEVRNDGTYASKYSFSPLPSFYFLIGENFFDDFELNLKPGILIIPNNDFNGFEIGLIGNKDNFLTRKTYLTGGINLHFISETAHGTSLVEATDSKIIYFLLLGLGYKLSDNIAIDITFHQALNPEYGYKAYSYEYNNIKGPTKLYNLIKVGFQFTTD
jgi:hypothetical protein